MAKRKLKFVKERIVKDEEQGFSLKLLILDIKKTKFTFKPYVYKPEESWEIGRIIFSIDERSDLYNQLKTDKKFELTVKDDKEIYFVDGNTNGGSLTDFRVFHKDAVTSSLGTGLIECDLNSTDISKIKLKTENEIPFDPSTARQQAIQRIKKEWKDNSSDKTETGTINNKSITRVLGTNWEIDFNNYDTREDIKQYENQLFSKIINELLNREIKIKFTVKEAQETRERNQHHYDDIKLKISTDYLMSTLYPRLDLIHLGDIQDAPFSDIIFLFNNEQVNSETYEMLAESEGEEFELSFNLSKIYFEIYGMVNAPENKPKIAMVAESKALKVFFAHPDAPKVITIQKTGENPDQDDTPKLNDLTNLLDQALSPNSTEQDKITALEKSGEFLGFITPENQTKITQINQALANNPTRLSQALREKIEKELTTNNLIINDLPPKGKTIYQNIKNGSLTQSSKIQAEEQKLTQIIGETGAKKNLDHLETQIRQVLSSSDLEAKKRLQKLLRKFLKSQNTFYQTEKPRAQQLNQELKKSIRENDFKQNSGIPWGKVLPFAAAGIGFFLIILFIINLSRSPRKRKYPY